jgi:hypothetical protein
MCLNGRQRQERQHIRIRRAVDDESDKHIAEFSEPSRPRPSCRSVWRYLMRADRTETCGPFQLGKLKSCCAVSRAGDVLRSLPLQTPDGGRLIGGKDETPLGAAWRISDFIACIAKRCQAEALGRRRLRLYRDRPKDRQGRSGQQRRLHVGHLHLYAMRHQRRHCQQLREENRIL